MVCAQCCVLLSPRGSKLSPFFPPDDGGATQTIIIIKYVINVVKRRKTTQHYSRGVRTRNFKAKANLAGKLPAEKFARTCIEIVYKQIMTGWLAG